MLDTLGAEKRLLFTAVSLLVLFVFVRPGFAWVAKSAAEAVAVHGLTREASAQFAPLFAGLLVVWAGLWFASEWALRLLQTRIVMGLQRTYLDRRRKDDKLHDVSRMLWDAKQARYGLEVFFRDSVMIGMSLAAMAVWQWALAPDWFPAVGVALTPALLAMLLFGPFVESSSLDVMEGINAVSLAAEKGDLEKVNAAQETLYGHFRRWFAYRSGTLASINLVYWSGVLLVLALDLGLGVPLIPKDARLGAPVFFFGQLKLLVGPLSSFGRLFNNLRSSLPALERVYYP